MVLDTVVVHTVVVQTHLVAVVDMDVNENSHSVMEQIQWVMAHTYLVVHIHSRSQQNHFEVETRHSWCLSSFSRSWKDHTKAFC